MRRPSLILIVFMLLTMVSGTIVSAAVPTVRIVADSDHETQYTTFSMNKLPDDILEAAEGEILDALVYLTEQVDTPTIVKQAQSIKPAWVSSKTHRNLVRRKVVDALQNAAAQSQQPLLEVLKRGTNQGTVKAFSPYFAVNAIHVQADKEILLELAESPAVAHIVPNPLFQIQEVAPPDPECEWNIVMADAVSVWNMGSRGAGIVVGIIDTGVDWQHPAIKQKWRGYNPEDPDNPQPAGNWYDVLNPTSNILPTDPNGHGTHVAGIIVGEDPVTGRMYGMAPDAQWIAVNAFSSDRVATGSDLLAAGQYMLAPLDSTGTHRPEWAPDIINNSWGRAVSDTSASDFEFFRPMVINWRSAGILPVFAAGNTGPDLNTINEPGCYPESVAVGMIDQSYNLDSQSARGPGFYEGWIKPDLVAPGVNILSCQSGGGYVSMTGTSMAAPHVAGAAALIMSKLPGITLYEVEHTLKSNADPMLYSDAGGNRPSDSFGWGKVAANQSIAIYTWGYFTYAVFNHNAYVVSGMNISESMRISESFYSNRVLGVEYAALSGLGIPGIELPQYLIYMDDYAMAENNLTQITFPDGFIHLGAETLANNQLTEVFFPESIETIGTNALAGNQLDPADLVIKGYSGTPAETYAALNGHTFVNLRPAAITLNQTPTNGGSVLGAGTYVPGTQVTVRAVPATSFTFVHWLEGDTVVSENAEYTFSAEADRQLTAVFTPITYTIIGSSQPEGFGTIIGTGCYTYGQQVSLQSIPADGYRFRYFEEGAVKYTQNPFTFTAYGDRSFTAVLREQIDSQRISGSDRYATAVSICQEGWPTGADHVIVVRGDVFADALAGVPLAYQMNAPILLTASTRLSQTTKTEIIRLGADRITILGGNAAVSETVENELKGMGLIVERIFGDSRYETAALIAQTLPQPSAVPNTAVLVVGTSFPDALAVSSYAAEAGIPILLTRGDALPGVTHTALSDLSIDNVLVIGGPNAISNAVYDQLPQGALTSRIYGANRYETSVRLAQYFGVGTESFVMATGINFPDAMAGGAWAAKRGMGILLTDGQQNKPHASIESFLINESTDQVYLLGGFSALSAALEEWF